MLTDVAEDEMVETELYMFAHMAQDFCLNEMMLCAHGAGLCCNEAVFHAL